MLTLKGETKKGKTRYARFSINCREIETRILPGDELVFTGDDHSPNVFLHRVFSHGFRAMNIVSNQGEDIFGTSGKIFTEEEVRLIALILAASFGLSFERDTSSASKDKKNIIFRFGRT